MAVGCRPKNLEVSNPPNPLPQTPGGSGPLNAFPRRANLLGGTGILRRLNRSSLVPGNHRESYGRWVVPAWAFNTLCQQQPSEIDFLVNWFINLAPLARHAHRFHRVAGGVGFNRINQFFTVPDL